MKPRNVFIASTHLTFMYSTKPRGLRCEKITHGGFSGERVCHFNIYEGGEIVQASPCAPKGYVDENSKIVRVKAIRVQGDKTNISFPCGGIGDFDSLTVPSDGLVDLVEDTL